MRSLIAALRSLVLPNGATSGARIVLDGVNGTITIYDSSGVGFVVLSPTDGLRIGDPAGRRIIVDMAGAQPSIFFLAPGWELAGNIRGTTLGAGSPALVLDTPEEPGGDGLRLSLWGEDVSTGQRPQFRIGASSIAPNFDLAVAEAANMPLGVATLVAGSVVVPHTNVTATSRIFVSRQAAGGAPGHLSVSRIAGTSFTITSSSATDTSTVAWLLIQPV